MKILSIGNSFSMDAQRYIHSIARSDKKDITAANLYIGGCPLELHYRNMLGQKADYEFWLNGFNSFLKVSLDDALLSTDWDVVTLQQASHVSFDYESYQPYLNALAAYVRECVPKAKIVVHQTWAYEKDSNRLLNVAKFDTPKEMFAKIEDAYSKAAKDINADLIIPSGKLLDMLTDSGIEKVHRDTFHASYGLGRYAIGLLWYTLLTGNDITDNSFDDFDEEITAEQIAIAKDCVKKLAKIK